MTETIKKPRLINDQDRMWLGELVKKANNNDPAAQAELCAFLDANPAVYRRAGNIALPLEARWIELIANGNRLIEESVRRETNERRSVLLGANASEVVAMVVNLVILCYLELQYYQVRFAEMEGAPKGQLTMQLKRLDSAQKRLGLAVRALGDARKLAAKGVLAASVPAYKTRSED